MHVLRHKRSDTFMCLSLLFAFAVCWIVIGTIEALNGSRRIQRNHLYNSEWEVIIETNEFVDFSPILAATDNLHGVVTIEDITIPVDFTGGEYTGRAVLFQDEGVKYSADGESIGALYLDGKVLLGSDFEGGVCNGEISLGMELFGVAAIERAKWRSVYDHSVVVPYELLDLSVQKTAFRNGTVGVLFASDRYDTKVVAASFITAFQSFGTKAFLTLREHSMIINGDAERGFLFFYLLAYAFCAGNCMVAAELWGLERKREIAIRRAFGFSAMQIQRCLLSEFLKLSVISLAISSVGIGVVGIFTKRQWITSGLSGHGVLTFTAFFVLTAILSVIPVSVRAVRGSSVNQMIQRG